MLSRYQLMFLNHLNAYPVRYLVIGAQGRRQCKGKPGHDLDLWVELTPANLVSLLEVLQRWIGANPLHVRSGTLETLPSQLRDALQLTFPEFDDCGFFDGEEGGLVSAADGIDLLIGGATIPTFNDCFERSALVGVHHDINVRCLSREDDDRFPRLAREGFEHGTSPEGHPK